MLRNVRRSNTMSERAGLEVATDVVLPYRVCQPAERASPSRVDVTDSNDTFTRSSAYARLVSKVVLA